MNGALTSLLQSVSGYCGSSTLKQDKFIALLEVPVSKQSFWRNI